MPIGPDGRSIKSGANTHNQHQSQGSTTPSPLRTNPSSSSGGGYGCLFMIVIAIAMVIFQSNKTPAPTQVQSGNSTTKTSHDQTDNNTDAKNSETVLVKDEDEISAMSLSSTQDEISNLLARFGYAFKSSSLRAKYQALAWYHPQVGVSSEEIIKRIESDAELGSYFKALVKHRDALKHPEADRTASSVVSIPDSALPSKSEINDMDYAAAQHHIHELMARFGYDFKEDEVRKEYTSLDWYHPQPTLSSAQVIALIGKDTRTGPIFRDLVTRRNELRESIYGDIKTYIIEASEAEVKVRQANDMSLMEGKYVGKRLDELQQQIEANIEQKQYTEMKLVSHSFEDKNFHLDRGGQKAEARFIEVWQTRRFSTENKEPLSDEKTITMRQRVSLLLKDERWLIEAIDFTGSDR